MVFDTSPLEGLRPFPKGEIPDDHAALGNLDQVCTALRRVLDDRSLTIGWMKLDPRMDPLRSQICYTEVAGKLYAP